MTDRYAVMGNPVEHSKSPVIHGLFAAETGQDIRYDKILVSLEGFREAVDDFQREGGKGLNITVPFKQEAWASVDERSHRAEKAGAVNTIVFRQDGSRYGDNTDGVGLVRDLTANHGVAIEGRDVVVLGAGGAVRGILPSLIAARPRRIVIANRTLLRAEQLADVFHTDFPIKACGFADLHPRQADVLINATSAGLHGELPPLPDHILKPGATCYDMVYADQPTVFVRWAQQHGAAKALDGLGMLVEQAAESFYLWREVRPGTAQVIADLRTAKPA